MKKFRNWFSDHNSTEFWLATNLLLLIINFFWRLFVGVTIFPWKGIIIQMGSSTPQENFSKEYPRLFVLRYIFKKAYRYSVYIEIINYFPGKFVIENFQATK